MAVPKRHRRRTINKEYFRRKLIRMREQTLKNLEELREELRGLQETPNELEEWAQEEKDRDILIRLERREKAELGKIENALSRLEASSFGICGKCGKPIPKARLEEVPTAFLCRTCMA